jgi:hypothetical protein
MKHTAICVIAFAAVACSPKKDSPSLLDSPSQAPKKTTPRLPLKNYFPEFHTLWINLAKEHQILIEPSKKEIDLFPIPFAWYRQTGSILKVYIEATENTPEQNQALIFLQQVMAKNEPAPHFRLLLKAELVSETPNNSPTEPSSEISAQIKKPNLNFYEIIIPKQASALEKEICSSIIPWIHSRQLLEKNPEEKAPLKNSNKFLICRLKDFNNPIKPVPNIPKLQITELPLPYVHPSSNEILFRQPRDLTNPAQLEKLSELFP